VKKFRIFGVFIDERDDWRGPWVSIALAALMITLIAGCQPRSPTDGQAGHDPLKVAVYEANSGSAPRISVALDEMLSRSAQAAGPRTSARCRTSGSRFRLRLLFIPRTSA